MTQEAITSYDAMGREVSSTDQNTGEVTTTTYDFMGRVVKTERSLTDQEGNKTSQTETKSYNANGAVTSETSSAGVTTEYRYDSRNRVTTTKEDADNTTKTTETSYGYETAVIHTLAGTKTYKDLQVQTTKVNGKTAVIQQKRYNGDGQRIQKVEGSKTTNYYYQDGVVSYTTDGDNSQTSQNLIGTDGNVLATERFQQNATQYYLYNKDIQGSTSSLVKEDGSADATYQYTDFGETTINGDNKAENEVCYTGGIYDHSTGLYYLNARYYNPEDGRFVTEDTYRGETAKPETGHLYAYCANNPVNYVDPSGHFAAAMYTVIKLVLVGGAVAYVSYSSWKNHSSKTKYAGRKIISKTKVSVWLTAGVVDRIIYSKSKKKSNTKKKKESKKVKKKERQIFQVGHMDLDQKKGKVEMSMQLGK